MKLLADLNNYQTTFKHITNISVINNVIKLYDNRCYNLYL